MPFSSNSGKQYISNLINNLPGRIKEMPVLDIGAGSGTYSKLFKDKLTGPWTGIEIFGSYVEKYNLTKLYNYLYTLDALTFLRDDNSKYGVIFLGDVLEHMPANDAFYVLQACKANAEVVVVSIPIGYYPQDEYDSNPHERHITDNWSVESFHEVFGQSAVHAVDNEIGVFVYSNEPVSLMKRPKVAIYAISKNEEKYVETFCESSKEADYIIIADTGSTDRTVELGKQYGAAVYSITVNPWRFDRARNASLALVPKDVDVCICLDLDEKMEPGWRQIIDQVWQGGFTRLRYKFDWSQGVVFYSDKIHARNGYAWHHPCHELLYPDNPEAEKWASVDNLLITHHPDPTKSRGSYLNLLEIGVKEDPDCPRNSFYHARELFFYSRWSDAISALNRFLTLPRATWTVERAYAMRLLGKSHQALSNLSEAETWFLRAVAEDRTQREPLIDLADFYRTQSKWQDVLYYTQKALSIVNRELLYTVDPTAWSWKPHDLLALALYYTGDKNRALEHGEIACQFAPDDQRLKDNLKFYDGSKE